MTYIAVIRKEHLDKDAPSSRRIEGNDSYLLRVLQEPHPSRNTDATSHNLQFYTSARYDG